MLFKLSPAIQVQFINVHVVSKAACTFLRLTVNSAGSACYSYKEKRKEGRKKKE